MITRSRKLDIVVGIFIVGLVSFALGVQGGYSWTGTWNTLSDGYMEVQNVNATYYYLDDTNITARLTGDWGSTNLTTTGAVSTADLNFTSEFYYNGENVTDILANPENAFSQLIDSDGSSYRVKNGSTGQIDYTSTSLEDVLEYAFTSNTTNIFRGQGETWTLEDQVDVTNVDYLKIITDWSLTIKAEPGFNNTMFYFDNCDFLTIDGLSYDGSWDEGTWTDDDYHGMRFKACDNLKLYNIRERSSHRFGIWIGTGCDNFEVKGCDMNGARWNSLQLGYGANDGWVHHSKFGNNSDVSVTVYAGNDANEWCSDIVVENNIIEYMYMTEGHSDSHWGMALEGESSAARTYRITFSNNRLIDIYRMAFSCMAGTHYDTLIEGNTAYNSTLKDGRKVFNIAACVNPKVAFNTAIDCANDSSTSFYIEAVLSAIIIGNEDRSSLDTSNSHTAFKIKNCLNVITSQNIVNCTGAGGTQTGFIIENTNSSEFILNRIIQIEDRGVTLTQAATDNLITLNLVGDVSNAFLIDSSMDGTGNRFHENSVTGTVTTVFNPLSNTGFILDSWSAPFISGTTLLNTSGAIQGWEIDANAEYALGFIVLPEEVDVIERFKVFGYTVIAETHNMTLELQMYGSATDEVFSTETITIGTWNSTTYNVGVDDGIVWTAYDDDDDDLDDLRGGDIIQVKVLHEAASGGACATDAVLLWFSFEGI